MNRYCSIRLILGIGLMFLALSGGAILPEEDQPRKKIPKQRVIDELEKLRNKNLKKIKGDVEGVLKFRSSDFNQEYYIGGAPQNYAQGIMSKLIEGLKDDFPEIYEELKNKVKVYMVYDLTLNAHATRNNNILLTSQWMVNAESEDEIAALLAHELAHIVLKHPDTNVDRDKQTQAVKKFVEMASIVSFFANMETKSSGKNLQVYIDDSGKEELLKTVFIGKLMSDVKHHYINKKISRKHEEQADYFASDLMELVGYNPVAATTMLKLLYVDEMNTEEVIEATEDMVEYISPLFESWVSHELVRLAGDDPLKLVLATVIQQQAAQIAQKLGGWFRDKKRSHMKAAIRYHRVDVYNTHYNYYDDRPDYGDGDSENNRLNFNDIQSQVTLVHDQLSKLDSASGSIDVRLYNESSDILDNVFKFLKKQDSVIFQPVFIKYRIVKAKLRIAQSKPGDIEKALINLCEKIMMFKTSDCFAEDFAAQATNMGIIIPQDFFVLLAESYIHLEKFKEAETVIQQGTEYYDEHPFHLHNTLLACERRDYLSFRKSLEMCQETGVFDSVALCGAINNELQVMKKSADEELQKTKPFSSVKLEELNWWTPCEALKNKDYRPLSTVKTASQVAEIKRRLQQIEEMKKKQAKELTAEAADE